MSPSELSVGTLLSTWDWFKKFEFKDTFTWNTFTEQGIFLKPRHIDLNPKQNCSKNLLS